MSDTTYGGSPSGTPGDDLGQRLLVFSRLDLEVASVELPRMSDRDIQGYLDFKKGALFPAPEEGTLLDYRRLPVNGDGQVTVFLASGDVVESIRAEYPEYRLISPLQVVVALGAHKGVGSVVYWSRHWADVLRFDDSGRFLSSTPLLREHGNREFKRLEALLPPGDDVRVILAPTLEAHDGLRLLADMEHAGYRAESISSALMVGEKNREAPGLFEANTRDASRARRRRITAYLTLSLLLLATSGFLQLRQMQSTANDLRADVQAAQAAATEQSRENERRRELARRVEELRQNLPTDAYATLFAVTELVDGHGEILRLTLSGRAVTVEVLADDALDLVDRFSSDLRFGGVTVSQITPVPGGAREHCAISVEYLP